MLRRPSLAGYVLGEMSFLRCLTIIDAISDANDNGVDLPTIHLNKLEMLHVEDMFHKSVTLINQLITPPRCGLRVGCQLARIGVDQRMLWAILEMKLYLWEKGEAVASRQCIRDVQSAWET